MSEKKLHTGQAGLRIIVASGEMMVYADFTNELLYRRPFYEGEWDELWDFLLNDVEATA